MYIASARKVEIWRLERNRQNSLFSKCQACAWGLMPLMAGHSGSSDVIKCFPCKMRTGWRGQSGLTDYGLFLSCTLLHRLFLTQGQGRAAAGDGSLQAPSAGWPAAGPEGQRQLRLRLHGGPSGQAALPRDLSGNPGLSQSAGSSQFMIFYY